MGSIPQRRRHPHQLHPLLCAAILVPLLVTSGTIRVRAAGGTSAKHPPSATQKLLGGVQFQSVACPDPHTCFAVGEHVVAGPHPPTLRILVTHDGGASWTVARTQPKAAFAFISCPDALHCFVTGAFYSGSGQETGFSFLSTGDGGVSWRQSTIKLTPAPSVVFGLACPSATVCYLAGTIFPSTPSSSAPQGRAVVGITTDGGKSWGAAVIPAAMSLNLRAIACSGPTSCDVGGMGGSDSCYQAAAILRTDDGGKTWTPQYDACAAAVAALSCPSSSACYAAGWYGSAFASGNQLVLHSGAGGATWDDVFEGPIDPTYSPYNQNGAPPISINCPAAQTCFVPAGGEMLTTTDAGVSWTVRTPLGGVWLDSVSCSSPQTCVAVGDTQPSQQGSPSLPSGIIVRTSDGGSTWTKV